MEHNQQLCMTLLFLVFYVMYAACDYENTWNFYYEQPCCGGANNVGPNGIGAAGNGPHNAKYKRGTL